MAAGALELHGTGGGGPGESARRRRARALAPLIVVFSSAGLSTALAMPFLTLFLTSAVHATPLRISLFLIAQPLCGISAATVLGRLSDRRFQRRHVLLAAAIAGCASCVCYSMVRNYWLLLLVACTVNGVGGAVMPQSFAYARAILAGDPAAAMLTSTLRTFFSLAWVAGPPLASLLLTAGGFGWLYVSSAVLYAIVAAVAAFWLAASPRGHLPRPVADRLPAPEPSDAGRRALWLTIVGLAVIQSSLSANVQALPLHIRQDLHGDVRGAGLVLGLCAALEIPAMLGFGALSTRIPLWKLMRLGPLFGAAYFVVAATAGEVWQVAAAQLLNACFIAVISGLGVSYVQELLPSQPGRASTLYSNAFPCGAILASPVLGLGARFGYRLPYAVAAGLTMVGLMLLTAGARGRCRDRRSPRGESLPEP